MQRIRYAALALGAPPASAQPPAAEPTAAAAVASAAPGANSAISGVIKDAYGGPLRNIVVNIVDSSGSIVATAKTNALLQAAFERPFKP